jgi:4'-phosphopantetheinyl transferase
LAAAGKPIGAADGPLPPTLERIALPDPAIAVWLARLDPDVDQVGRCASVLSRGEQQRAGRFHFERDRRRFVVTRGILRTLLGGCLAVAPDAIAFGYGKNGKPFVASENTSIHFNVSHSHERALYAISRSHALGVDIEYLNRDVDCNGLARRFFTRCEYSELQRIPESGRKHAFLSCWTHKEAVIKATGDGLSLPLDQFNVTVALEDTPRVLDFVGSAKRASDWDLYAIDVGAEYVATVATFRRG